MLGKPCGNGLQRNSRNVVLAPPARLTMASPTPVYTPLGPVCESHQLSDASRSPTPDSFPSPNSLSVMLLSWIAVTSAPGRMVMPSPLLLAMEFSITWLPAPIAARIRPELAELAMLLAAIVEPMPDSDTAQPLVPP